MIFHSLGSIRGSIPSLPLPTSYSFLRDGKINITEKAIRLNLDGIRRRGDLGLRTLALQSKHTLLSVVSPCFCHS